MMLMRRVPPGAGRRRRGDRDAALLLLLHPVHGRSSLMHLADTVRDARIEQDALGRRRLSGVDVSHDPDVPAMVQSYSACHGVNLSLCKASLAGQSKLISNRSGSALFPVPCLTSGSGRMPCWPRPCGVHLPSSSSPRRVHWRRPAARRSASPPCPSRRARGHR